MNEVYEILKKSAFRLKLSRAIRYALYGVFLSGILSLVILSLGLYFHDFVYRDLIIFIPFAGLIVGFLSGFFKELTPEAVALLADRRASSKERLTTAVMLEEHQLKTHSKAKSEFRNLVIEDAKKVASRITAHQLFPIRAERQDLMPSLGVYGLVLIVFFWNPKLDFGQTKTAPKKIQPSKTASKLLKSKAKKLSKKSKEIDDPELKQLAHKMNMLTQALNNGKLDKKQALAELSKLSEKMKKLREKRKSEQKALKMMAKSPNLSKFAKSLAKGDKKNARKLIDKMSQKMKKGGLKGKSLDQLNSELKKLSEATSKNESLRKAFDRAQQALKEGKSKEFSQRMKEIADQLDKTAQAMGKNKGSQGGKEGFGGEEGSQKGNKNGSQNGNQNGSQNGGQKGSQSGNQGGNQKSGNQQQSGNQQGNQQGGANSQGNMDNSEGNSGEGQMNELNQKEVEEAIKAIDDVKNEISQGGQQAGGQQAGGQQAGGHQHSDGST